MFASLFLCCRETFVWLPTRALRDAAARLNNNNKKTVSVHNLGRRRTRALC